MQGEIMFKRILVGTAVAAFLAACGQGGFQRGVFHGKVIDKTPEEVVSSFGKPDAIDRRSLTAHATSTRTRPSIRTT